MHEKIIKIGIGYDIHKLVENRELVLGGVNIPFNKGLLGHSDADVLIHAIVDAIIGALGLGDIGEFFPDTDIQFKDKNSLFFLEQTKNLMNEKGYKVNNIDCIINAEKPKLSSYTNQMKKNISKILDISENEINIKCKTGEGIGEIGELKAMSSYCVVIIEKL